MDELIKIAQDENNKIVFKYSTASEYYQAVKNETETNKVELPKYTEDFMPLQ